MSFSENCTIELIEVDSDGGVVEDEQLVQIVENSPGKQNKKKKRGLAGLSTDKTNKFKDQEPSRDWIKRFRKRHPDVCLRKPHAVTRTSTVVSPEEIVNFIKNLREYFEKRHQRNQEIKTKTR